MKAIKKILIVSSLFITQLSFTQVIDNPKASIRLNMQQTGGTNGCAIAYNPVKDLYYAVIAGNAAFPLEVFDGSGKNVYQTEAGSDMRGIWWNPKTNTLEGNGYGDAGIMSFAMNDEAFPALGNTILFEGGSHQPNGQAVGTYDSKKKRIVYFDNGNTIFYKRKSGENSGQLALKIDNMNNINDKTLIYTGKKKMEYGILDFENNKVLLFNAKNGELTKTINLPYEAVTHDIFRFGFANDHVFLYDVEERSWIGYKIFN